MIRDCGPDDFRAMVEIINDAADLGQDDVARVALQLGLGEIHRA